MRRLPLPLLLLCGLTAGEGANQLPRPGRSPRQLALTEGASARGELVVWMPLTVVLPSLGYRSRYTSTARSQRQLGRERRDGANQVSSNRTSYDWAAPEYRTAGSVGALLSRVDAYFHYLRVHDEHCRHRTICQSVQEAETFAPFSSLVLRALRKSDSYQLRAAGSPAEQRFSQYRRAAGQGAAGVDCRRAYARCTADARDVINMRVLWLWQLLSGLVALHITDD